MIHRFPILFLAAAMTTAVGGDSEVRAQNDLPIVSAADADLDSAQLRHIEPLIQQSLDHGDMAGCVVAIGRRGKIGFLEAFGHRQLKPDPIPMTTDTVFDLASLTKPIATATSIMVLVDRGQVRLRDKAATYLPEFTSAGKSEITVHQLLTHQGGLIPDNALSDYEQGLQTAREKVMQLTPRDEPGNRFIYSDVGFIVLGWIVEQVSGKGLHEFSQAEIFSRMGMSDTGYLPRDELQARAAATEQRDGKWMVGEVHDPRAHLMQGVAGHAGLFSTARDLAKYAHMMLSRGRWHDQPILSRRAIEIMTQAYPVSSGRRGLGWDKLTGYSSNRGELMSEAAFGHGGFTGTAMWLDPELDLFVIFLSTRLHPDGKGNVNRLAGQIGTIACSACRDDDSQPPASVAPSRNSAGGDASAGDVLPGIDVVERSGFAALRGKRVGLITNHTGRSLDGRSTLEILHQAPQVDLQAVFSPEHGLEGKLDMATIRDSTDSGTGLRVYSLYGETRQPTADMLKGIDVLVFDVQDIGTRFYTYVSTMGLAMEAAGKHDVAFLVLDRPNPLNGLAVQGPLLDAGQESFVGFHSLPIRHGMTVGELALMFRSERNWPVDLDVVRVQGWQRQYWFEHTGMRWINPSPNMRSPQAALLYPGVGLLETTNVSVGRGTDAPFELIGAPWIDARDWARALNDQRIPGVWFVPTDFTPDASTFADQLCHGVRVMVSNRRQVDPQRVGWALASSLRHMYADDWKIDRYQRLLGNQQQWERVRDGQSATELVEACRADEQAFRQRRQPFLLY